MESPPNTGSRGISSRKFVFWVIVSLGVNFLVSGGTLIYVRQLYGAEQLSKDQAELWGIAALIGGPLVGSAILVFAAWRLLRRAGPRRGDP